jgi:hypothetical protein
MQHSKPRPEIPQGVAAILQKIDVSGGIITSGLCATPEDQALFDAGDEGKPPKSATDADIQG